jgi:tetratricopeptide (TPR) repeat protein
MRKLMAAGCLLMVVTIAHALPFQSKLNKGNDLYHRGLFARSAQVYNDILSKQQDNKALFNLGNSLYQQGKYSESEQLFTRVSAEATDLKLKEKALYNVGNARFRQENYQGAVNAYTGALKIDPQDEDARYNLELAKKLLKTPPKQRPKQNKKEEKNNQNKNQNKEKQKQEQQKQQLSKEDAARILQGLNNDGKHKAKKMKAGQGKNDQDW